MNKFYVTTPIYYPSGSLHIGNAYCTIAADAIARYKRMRGYDVFFLTGTDEHGQKIQRRAEAQGISPKKYVDNIVEGIIKLWKLLDISNDKFIRTTDDYHKEAVQKIFKKLYDQGDIYKGEYEGYYCTPCELYITERQLVNGKCPDCNREVELAKEECYYFRASKYTDRLIKHIEDNPKFILPEARKNEILNNFLKPGFEDFCVSRNTFNWGIPVDFAPGHVVYVWIDALSNYINALDYINGGELYKKYWPAELHLVGKDIMRFHTIIWPCILLALGEPLPETVFGTGWLLLDGAKISKSADAKGIVDPVILSDRYGVDAIRYFVLREMPYSSDASFTNEALINRINTDLANDLGNLVARTVAMVEKYQADPGESPACKEDTDDSLRELALNSVQKYAEYMEQYMLSAAAVEIFKLVSRANKYIDETQPWILAKDDNAKARLATVMFNLCETIRVIGVLIKPFMPSTSENIFSQICFDDSLRTWDSLSKWQEQSSLIIKKAPVMFPRIDLEKELKELAELAKITGKNS